MWPLRCRFFISFDPAIGRHNQANVACSFQHLPAEWRYIIVTGTIAMRSTLLASFSGLALVTASLTSALAAPVTYQVNQTIGVGSVVGTIETDGASGVLTGSNIIAFSLNLNGAQGASYQLVSGSSSVLVVGNDLTATPTSLMFNFSGFDNGYLLFQQTLFTGMHYYCNATSSSDCYQGATVAPGSINDPSAQTAARSGVQTIGTVATAVPEPVSLALLAFGLAGLGLIRHRNA